MDIGLFSELVSSQGFPIACVIAMGVFIAYMVKYTTELNNKNMEKVQDRCLAREEKLFEEIRLNREINGKAIETIAQYAEKLDTIQTDINEIKKEVIVLTTKIE